MTERHQVTYRALRLRKLGASAQGEGSTRKDWVYSGCFVVLFLLCSCCWWLLFDRLLQVAELAGLESVPQETGMEREEEMRRLTTPVENESADIEAGCTSQGTSALEAEGKGEIKSQALQGAEDKAKQVSEPAHNESPASEVSYPKGNLTPHPNLIPAPEPNPNPAPIPLTPTLSLTLTL